MPAAEQEPTVQTAPDRAPCCSVSLAQLRRAACRPTADTPEEIEQRRFEQACARELLGDTD